MARLAVSLEENRVEQRGCKYGLSFMVDGR
jgi:hypothetical protein